MHFGDRALKSDLQAKSAVDGVQKLLGSETIFEFKCVWQQPSLAGSLVFLSPEPSLRSAAPGRWHLESAQFHLLPGHFQTESFQFDLPPAHSDLESSQFQTESVQFDLLPAHSELETSQFQLPPGQFHPTPDQWQTEPVHFEVEMPHWQAEPEFRRMQESDEQGETPR